MKKSFFKIVMLCSLFALLNVAAFADDAIVTSVKGKVEVSHGGDTWKALAVGDTVSESDVVSTGFQSEVRIKYNGSVMLLGALTRVTLDQMSSNSKTDKVDVFLNTGAVRSKVTHTDDKKVSYNVRGPVAVASVRGTDFTCFANGSVMCWEGAVAVYSAKNYVEPSNSDVVAEETEESEEGEESADSTVASEESSDSAAEASDAVATTSETTDSVVEATAVASSDTPTTTSEGPATATTPANEISSNAPAGAVVVGKNQETKISTNGKATKPLEVSTKNMTKVKGQVSSAAAKESVSTGTAGGDTPTPVDPVVKKATISIKVSIDEE